jgi:hypothetical protein
MRLLRAMIGMWLDLILDGANGASVILGRAHCVAFRVKAAEHFVDCFLVRADESAKLQRHVVRAKAQFMLQSSARSSIAIEVGGSTLALIQVSFDFTSTAVQLVASRTWVPLGWQADIISVFVTAQMILVCTLGTAVHIA